MRVILRGRRSIWWRWSMSPVAPRIWCFACEQDQSWVSFFVAGAAFGDVAGSLFVAGGNVTLRGRRKIWWCWSVTFRGRQSIWWNLASRSTKRCHFQYKVRLRSAKSKLGERGARWPRIVNDVLYMRRINHESHFRGRRSIWWCGRFFLTGAAFGDVGASLCGAGAAFGDVGVSRNFAWQAQSLVRLEDDACC